MVEKTAAEKYGKYKSYKSETLDYWGEMFKVDYSKKNFIVDKNFKEVISELLEKLNGDNDKVVHRKILKEITFFCTKTGVYVYIRYDLYGFIRISKEGIVLEFMAASGQEAIEKIEQFRKKIDNAYQIGYKAYDRKRLIEDYRRRQRRDKDGFLV